MDVTSGTKLYPSAEAALFDLGDGATIAVGGFGLCGNPEACIRAIAARGPRGLTIISNNCGNQGKGLAILLQQRQVARVICSFVVAGAAGKPAISGLGRNTRLPSACA